MSYEFVGPTKNGGIGTAYTSMAEALAEAGHEVTCLFVGEPPLEGPTMDDWINTYRRKGIRLVAVPAVTHLANRRPYIDRSYDVYAWFKANASFDIVHFPELLASGFHTLEAKRQGLIFQNTFVCVGIHSMTMWLRTAMQEWSVGITDLELDYMERRSVELADSVVSPSQYLLNWIADQGWALPPDSIVQPYVQPKVARSASAERKTKQIHEFVFFGRLETRKGIALFCDALDRLTANRHPELRRVTFLGRENVVEGQKAKDYIDTRAKHWPFATQLLTNLDQPEAIRYLLGEGRLAVIPSLMENSPNTVYECLGSGIPFLASRAGGIPELIHQQDAEDICFDLNPSALSARLHRSLTEGVATSRYAIDVVANESIWIKWHQQTAAAVRSRVAAFDTPGRPILVSVCIPTFNRPKLLEQALASIRRNGYAEIEVIVVDDGSFTSDALDTLPGLESQFRREGWKLVRQTNRYPGAARNAAAGVASGEYLFFMDDDDMAIPGQISTLVEVAMYCGADIVTSGALIFDGINSPPAIDSRTPRSLPFGGATAVGLHYNCFGEGNFLVKRATFERLGGFTEDFGVAGEEAEFHARATLNGASMAVVPEFLYWRRDHAECIRNAVRSQVPYSRRRLRPYTEYLPGALRGIAETGAAYFQREHARASNGSDYEALSLRWRSKYEAGKLLAAMGQRSSAERAYTDAVKSIESSKNWLVVLEALLAVGDAMRLIDVRRAAALAGMAQQIASFSPHEQHRVQAQALAVATRAGSAAPAAQSSIRKLQTA